MSRYIKEWNIAYALWTWGRSLRIAMSKYIKEWNITYAIYDGKDGLQEFFVILPSFRKVLWWFITRGHRACQIDIWTSARSK